MIIFLSKICKCKWFSKMICMILINSMLVFTILSITEIQAEEHLKMYAQSYALMDGDTGRVLVGKDETIPMANASTTKILTCIVTLEQCSLEEEVLVSSNAASQPKVRLGMKEGETYLLKDLLYGLMLESYNDCAVAIAEHVAGSEESFSDLMNEKARELKCENTYFLTPNGLDRESENGFHHTTATDLCKIMAYCVWQSPMKEEFLHITQMREYSGTANGKNYSFINRNAFLDQMDGVLSGKTGYTAKAGYCYVAAYENNGERYCVALLACGWPNHKTYKWSDTRTLFTYGAENYERKQVIIKDIEEYLEIDGYITPICFDMINQKDVLKVHADEKRYELLLGEAEKVKKEIVLYDNISLPIQEGQKVGVCRIYVEDMLLDNIELIAKESADVWGWKEIFQVILNRFLTFSS